MLRKSKGLKRPEARPNPRHGGRIQRTCPAAESPRRLLEEHLHFSELGNASIAWVWEEIRAAAFKSPDAWRAFLGSMLEEMTDDAFRPGEELDEFAARISAPAAERGARRGRPTKLTPDILRSLHSEFNSTDQTCRKIFAAARHSTERKLRARKEFTECGRCPACERGQRCEEFDKRRPWVDRALAPGGALRTFGTLRNHILAERFGLGLRGIEEFLRHEGRTLRIKMVLHRLPGDTRTGLTEISLPLEKPERPPQRDPQLLRCGCSVCPVCLRTMTSTAAAQMRHAKRCRNQTAGTHFHLTIRPPSGTRTPEMDSVRRALERLEPDHLTVEIQPARDA